MILERLEVHGFSTAFKSTTAVLDFTDLAPGVYAWCGPNGAGKTTAMESIVAALYREFTSYGYAAIKHVAPGVRDALIEVVVKLGLERYRLRLQADPAFGGGRGKTEHYLDRAGDEIGWRALAGPLVRDTEAAVAELFPTRDLFLAGPYAAQRGAGSFWQLELTEKKRLFVELLGHGKLQLLHAGAAARSKTIGVDLEALTQRVDQLRALVAQREELERLIGMSSETLAELIAGAEAHQGLLAEGRAAAEKCRLDLAAAETDLTAIRALVAERAAARQRHQATLTAAEQEFVAAQRAVNQLPAEATTDLTWARGELNVARSRVASANLTLAELDKIEHTVETELAREQQRLALTAELRGRAVLDGVDLTLELCQRCPLTERAREAGQRAEELVGAEGRPAADLQQELAEVRLAIGNYRRELRLCEETERRADAAEQRAFGEAMAIAAGEAGRRELELARERLEAARAVEMPEERSPHAVVTAEATVGALRKVATIAAEGVRGLEQQQRLVDDARREAERDLARREGQSNAIDKQIGPEDLTERTATLATLQRQRRGWSLLEVGLGPNGVQALEIDAAGPEVSQIANDLLLSCYGPRFQLRLETTRPLKTKAGQAEVFECAVIDAEADRTAHAGSGGEMVIVEEALRLGLAIYSTRQSGKECLTLFRDEAAGALDQWPGRDSAGRYLAMLRAARETGGFHHVHFIAHQPELFEAADGRFVFERGAVRFED